MPPGAGLRYCFGTWHKNPNCPRICRSELAFLGWTAPTRRPFLLPSLLSLRLWI